MTLGVPVPHGLTLLSRGCTMPKRKSVPFHREREKQYWNLYGLQGLAPERFARVVGRILDGRYLVFRPTPPPRLWF